MLERLKHPLHLAIVRKTKTNLRHRIVLEGHPALDSRLVLVKLRPSAKLQDLDSSLALVSHLNSSNKEEEGLVDRLPLERLLLLARAVCSVAVHLKEQVLVEDFLIWQDPLAASGRFRDPDSVRLSSNSSSSHQDLELDLEAPSQVACLESQESK